MDKLQEVLAELEGYALKSEVVAPSAYVDCAQRLISLSGGATDKLIELQQKVAQMKLYVMKGQEKRNVSAAELEIQASDEYAEMRRAQALVDRIQEQVNVSKVYARIKAQEFGQNF